jgi:hypothetical protein
MEDKLESSPWTWTFPAALPPAVRKGSGGVKEFRFFDEASQRLCRLLSEKALVV